MEGEITESPRAATPPFEGVPAAEVAALAADGGAAVPAPAPGGAAPPERGAAFEAEAAVEAAAVAAYTDTAQGYAPTNTSGDEALARELAREFAAEELAEQRRALLGGLALTLVRRASAASRVTSSPRTLVRDRQLLADVSNSISLLDSLMPALEATGLLPPMMSGSGSEPRRAEDAAPKGLAPSELASLPTCEGIDRPRFAGADENDEEDGCPICLCDVAPDEEVTTLPCLHSFHSKCVGDWLKRSVTCPCCNHDVAKTLRAARPPPTVAEGREAAALSRARLDLFAREFGAGPFGGDSDDSLRDEEEDDEDDLAYSHEPDY